MTFSVQRCTSDNKQSEGPCASKDEIDQFIKNTLIYTTQTSDMVDFEIREDKLPVYQKFEPFDTNGMNPDQPFRVDMFLRKHRVRTYDGFFNPLVVPSH